MPDGFWETFWPDTSLNTILKNERYIGTFLWNGIKKPNAIPAIVNPEEWQKVQEITKAKKKCIAKSRGENYLLTGRLFCGQCGGSMVGTAGTSKMQRVYHYYDCGNHLKRKGCTTKAIRADKLEDLSVIRPLSFSAIKTQSKPLQSKLSALKKNKGHPLCCNRSKIKRQTFQGNSKTA